jgi:predicted permease
MGKFTLKFDEREMNLLFKICIVMYVITLYALMIIQLFRQFVLHQSQQEWNDIALLITVNVIVLLGAALYLTGVVEPNKIKRSYLIAGYLGFVLLGFAFTIFKYTVLLGQQVSLSEVWDYLLTVILISGGLAIALGVMAYLGSRRINKQIE